MNDNVTSFLAMTHPVSFLAYDGFQLLDIAGPTSVFAETGAVTGAAPYSICIVSRRGGSIRSSSGIALASVDVARVGDAAGTLFVPGAEADALREVVADRTLRDWTASATSRAVRICSVCTGAFALAAWGLLDGRRAVTHWAAADELARRFPAIRVDREALYVEDGWVWTSAGVSTGIDMALAMVERDHGRPTAAAVARRLVLQARRPGHQAQFSALLDVQAGPYADLADWVGANLAGDLSLEALAKRAGQAPRTFHRRFSHATGSSPAVFVTRLRVDRARALLEAGTSAKSVAALCGFGSADHLRRAFRRALALGPSAYRLLHGP